VTNDVEMQRSNSGIKALLCNIKGRVETIVWIFKHSSDHYSVIVPRDNLDLLKRRLAPYLAFSKSNATEIDLTDYRLLYPVETLLFEQESALRFDDIALISPSQQAQLLTTHKSGSLTNFHEYRIRCGLVQLRPDLSGDYTPQALSLDSMGYISFKKGCYMGQEIIARLHYKGQSKHQLALLTGALNLASGATIQNSRHEIVGTIVDAEAAQAGVYLASLRVSADKAHGYQVEDAPLTLDSVFGK
jgi:folate-binding protein YgfZ